MMRASTFSKIVLFLLRILCGQEAYVFRKAITGTSCILYMYRTGFWLSTNDLWFQHKSVAVCATTAYTFAMPEANLDTLGKTYVGLAIAWTSTLLAGMTFLWYHRRLPCLQIRRLPLVFLAISPLHAYGTVCLIAYIIAPLAPCTAEYWMMSIWLPFGIAMFHAANSQFLHIASRQKQFARISSLDGNPAVNEAQAERLANSRFQRIIRGVERADQVKRTMIWIGAGLLVQVMDGSKFMGPSILTILACPYILFLLWIQKVSP